MSDSVRPHPWDSPGKNIGVGCHFLLQCIEVKSESEVAQSCLTLHNPMDCSLPGSSVHGILQARVLEWGAIANPKESVLKKKKKNNFIFTHEHTNCVSPNCKPNNSILYQKYCLLNSLSTKSPKTKA